MNCSNRHVSRPRCVLAALLMVGVLAGGVWADGMIVPIDPELKVQGNWAVTYHHVDVRVRQQVASVSITQEFVNTGSGMIEVEYLFPVPPDAAIDSMTLMVDGKEFAAKLLKADEARKIYEEIVRKKKDPALLEYAGFGLYRTRAFPLEVGKPAKVHVTYKYICKKTDSTVEVWYPLNTEKFSAQPIRDVKVTVDVEAPADISNVYSPTHKVSLERTGPRRVIATYHQQNVRPATDFQLFYTASDDNVGATLLTYDPAAGGDGYFLMLISPNPTVDRERIVPKDVVIVLDRSGSMSGEKIRQAREAGRFIIERLNEKDRFNLIVYSDTVEPFFEMLQPASKDMREQALGRLDSTEAAGGTNIHEALQQAMAMSAKPTVEAREAPSQPRAKYIIFLTDGLPTGGNTNESAILAETKNANKAGARVFAFGVGYDVNVRLLDKLTIDSRGRSNYVKPDEPIESKVAALYSKIRNPIMTNLKVSLTGVTLTQQYPQDLGDLVEGDQLVVVGRYPTQDVDKLAFNSSRQMTQLVVTGNYGGAERGFEYPVEITPGDKRFPFVETLWAVRRIGWLLDQIQLNGESQEVIDELVRLSMKHGIITPYTSFLADETTVLADRDGLNARASEETDDLGQVTGGTGQVGAGNRRAMKVAEQVPADSPSPSTSTVVMGDDSVDDYESGTKRSVSTVRRVGNRAIYQRGRQWIDSSATDVDPERDKDSITVVERMSDEYFEIVRANTTEENRVLATQQADEELLIQLRGRNYLIR